MTENLRTIKTNKLMNERDERCMTLFWLPCPCSAYSIYTK